MAGTKKVTVSHYRSGCIGCASCTAICPQDWELSDEDGLATLIDGQEKNGVFTKVVHPEDVDDNMVAASACPANVIKVN